MSETNIDVRQGRGVQSNCGVLTDILARIGSRWTVMVVRALSQGSKRYSEIASVVDGISQRMLTLTLKGLERDGLVTRTMYPTIPPRVDYELTERGRTLIAPLKALRTWSVQHQQAIEASRREYDAHVKHRK